MLTDCDGYIAGLDTVDRAALEGAARLKVVAGYGVGVDKIDLAAAAERGIVATNTPDANSVSVAELTIGLMLVLARSIPSLDREVRAGGWPRACGVTLKGKVVGLVGVGAIGKQVAVRLAGWGVRLLAHDPAVSQDTAVQVCATLVPLERLLAESDFVSLHVPLMAATWAMVDAAFLGRMKPGAYLINPARGELVDEAALQCGQLRGAALDAFCSEPPPPGILCSTSAMSS